MVAYATKLLPMTGLRACSARRVARGFFMMSQTSSLWYAFTGSALSLSTPKAHLSHQYGEWSPCAWWVPYGLRPAASILPSSSSAL